MITKTTLEKEKYMQLEPPTSNEETVEPLILHSTQVAEKVKPDAVSTLLPAISSERQSEINEKAESYLLKLSEISPRSPEFAAEIAKITALGKNEIVESSEFSSRLLNRSLQTTKKGKDTAEGKVSSTLTDLRATLEELRPTTAPDGFFKKVIQRIPGSRTLIRHKQKMESSNMQLEAIIRNLSTGQDELAKDNIDLESERKRLWKLMQDLNEYSQLTSSLDKAAKKQVDDLRNEGKNEEAGIVEADVLFPIRQRHQDILTQLAVSVQGYLAMDLVRKNNIELIRGVERARTGTVSALRTSIVVASSLENQRMVSESVDAINSQTSLLIEQTSIHLKEQSATIQRQASTSMIDPKALERAFENVFQTMDALDNFKAEAVNSLEQTTKVLSEQIRNSNSHVVRAKEIEN